MPVSRKGFALLRRRRDEAEGERRMMGSRRREGFFWRLETRVGWDGGSLLSEGRERRNVAAILR
jgi:hypothetical protein